MNPYRNQILHGNCLDLLRQIPDGVVQTVITSPPYWGLRDYGNPPTVWDEPDIDCEHEWGEEQAISVVRSPETVAGKSRTVTRYYGDESRKFNDNHQKHSRCQYCQKCGAMLCALGLEPSIDDFIRHMVEIFNEVYRVLRDDGTCWVNMGDSYANDTKWGGATSGKHARGLHGQTGVGRMGLTRAKNGVVEGHTDASSAGFRSSARYTNQKGRRGGVAGSGGLKPKDLVGQPWRLALAMQSAGWVLRQDNVWYKPNPMPESIKNRTTRAHEYLFQFAKSYETTYYEHRDGAGARHGRKPKPDYVYRVRATGMETRVPPADWKTAVDVRGERIWLRDNLWEAQDYYYDFTATLEPVSGGAHSMGNHHRNKVLPPGAGPRSNESYFSSMMGFASERQKRSVWEVPTHAFPEAHFATFPPALVEPCILAGSSDRACEHCGAPWSRRLAPASGGTVGESWHPHENDAMEGQRVTFSVGKGQPGDQQYVRGKTLGWFPTCECVDNTGSGRCIVLDPFMGSGTIAELAMKWGRDYLGCEQNADYIGMIDRRLAKTQPQLFTAVL